MSVANSSDAPKPGEPTAAPADPFERRRRDGYLISDDRQRLDLDRIAAWLARSYWASDRDRTTIERSIAASRTYGVYTADGTQVGLARVTTDDASFAWIGDVVIDETERGNGLGTWLVGAVVEHLRALGVPRFLLGTRDAHGVYARLGFEPLRVPEIYMEIDERPTRPSRTDVRA